MRRFLLLFIVIAYSGIANAQDPQFSQYYATPLLLNPALTGSADCYRAGMNVRSQWSGLSSPFNTGSAFADLNYPDMNSGFGLLVLQDKIGTSRLSTREISGLYRYEVSLDKKTDLRFGIQGSYVSRSVDYSNLNFEDQYSGTALVQSNTLDPVTQSLRVNFADISAGVLLYGEDKYWLGASAYHVNRPQQAFLDYSRLPVKVSLHGGYNIVLKTNRKKNDQWVFVPTFLYKSQMKFDQLDLGMYLLREKVLAGLWYRGIAIKKDENIVNNDAIVILGGYKFNDFSITYSYDFTTSKLAYKNTRGSHEISILYNFCLSWPPRKKPGRSSRRLPCPDFNRR